MPVIVLDAPLDRKAVAGLRIGDEVLMNGTVFTARDRAHQFLLEHHLVDIEGSVIYHCGPIIRDGTAVSAGPTTSSRMNRYTPALVREYGIRAIIGKGGMDATVAEALKGKAVYLSAVGGAAVLYAKTIKVRKVFKPEFGMLEAIWEFGVSGFPAVVAIDSRGGSLYEKVYQGSKAALQDLLKAGGK